MRHLLGAIAALFLALHSPDGSLVIVNPDLITSMIPARDDADDRKLATTGVRCVVRTTDGRFLAVREECDAVRTLIEQAR